MTPIREVLAFNIYRLRTEKGFHTQKDLEKAMGIHINMVESWKRWPRPSTLEKLAEVLECEYYELLLEPRTFFEGQDNVEERSDVQEDH